MKTINKIMEIVTNWINKIMNLFNIKYRAIIFGNKGGSSTPAPEPTPPIPSPIVSLVFNNTLGTSGVEDLYTYTIPENGEYKIEIGGSGYSGGEAIFQKLFNQNDIIKAKIMHGASGTHDGENYIAGDGIGIWIGNNCILAVGGSGASYLGGYGYGGGGYEGGSGSGTNGGSSGYSYDGTQGSYTVIALNYLPGDGNNNNASGRYSAWGNGGSGYCDPNYSQYITITACSNDESYGYLKITKVNT